MEEFFLQAVAATPSMGFVMFFLHYRIKKLEAYIDKHDDLIERVAVLEALNNISMVK